MNPKKNSAGVALFSLLNHLNHNQGFDIILKKNMPLSSGLGSSAASAVATVVGANALLNSPLKKKELLPFLLESEKVACGTAHADNVAPSLLGGFTLIRSYKPLDVININYPKNLFTSIIHPDLLINTQTSRSILKDTILLKDAVTQWGNIAGLIAGLEQGNLDVISRSLVDVIIEPIRSKLIPNYYSIKNAAMDAGSIGCSISGSGPSIFALSDSKEKAIYIGDKMKKECDKMNTSSTIYISKINNQGAKIIS